MSNANRNDPENPGHDPGAALAELCRLCSAEPESLGLAREIRTDRESESLAVLLDAKGALWTETAPPPSDELTGGEHFVYLDETHARVFKSTKPGKFGFSVGPELVRGRGRRTPPRIPRNVLTRPDGAVFAFDVVIVRPSADLKWSLRLTPPPS